MSDSYTRDYNRDVDGRPSLTRAFTTMPAWKVVALVVSLVVGVAATAGYFTTRSHRQAQTVTVQTTVPASPGAAATPGVGGSSFMGDTPAPPPAQPTTETKVVTPPPSITEQYTPVAAKVGFSFFVGLIAGVVSRTFIKLAAGLAVLAVAAVVALNYFHINLIDVSTVKAQTGQATSWISGQLNDLWVAIRGHLPSAGAAGAGFLVGMKRR